MPFCIICQESGLPCRCMRRNEGELPASILAAMERFAVSVANRRQAMIEHDGQAAFAIADTICGICRSMLIGAIRQSLGIVWTPRRKAKQ